MDPNYSDDFDSLLSNHRRGTYGQHRRRNHEANATTADSSNRRRHRKTIINRSRQKGHNRLFNDLASSSVRPMGQKTTKRKSKAKAIDTSSNMEDIFKEKMALMAEMIRLKEEENNLKKLELKMKEMEILLKDKFGMTDRQCQDHAMFCNMIRESH